MLLGVTRKEEPHSREASAFWPEIKTEPGHGAEVPALGGSETSSTALVSRGVEVGVASGVSPAHAHTADPMLRCTVPVGIPYLECISFDRFDRFDRTCIFFVFFLLTLMNSYRGTGGGGLTVKQPGP